MGFHRSMNGKRVGNWSLKFYTEFASFSVPVLLVQKWELRAFRRNLNGDTRPCEYEVEGGNRYCRLSKRYFVSCSSLGNVQLVSGFVYRHSETLQDNNILSHQFSHVILLIRKFTRFGPPWPWALPCHGNSSVFHFRNFSVWPLAACLWVSSKAIGYDSNESSLLGFHVWIIATGQSIIKGSSAKMSRILSSSAVKMSSRNGPNRKLDSV